MDPSIQVVIGLSVVGLVALQGLFAAAEIGFLATESARARHLRDKGVAGAAILYGLKAHPVRVVSTVLVCITASLYTAESLVTRWSQAVAPPGYEAVMPWVAMIGMTLFVVVFGEVTPVLYAAQKPERVALGTAGMIRFLAAVLYYPIVLPLTTIARGIVWLLGARERPREAMSAHYLEMVIEESEEHGGLTSPDAEMVRRVFQLGDITVSQIMAPRPDIISVEASEPLSKALELCIEHKHSRLPIYEGNLDNIVGICHSKDLLPHLRAEAMDKPCSHVSRPAHFVPENGKLVDLLEELQARQRMLAIAVDEFGGTAGIVTVEDVLEQIVGEILDETDVEEREIEPMGEGAHSCRASVSLHELAEVVGQSLPDHVDTLGGLVFEIAGRVPNEGEVFRHDNLLLTVQAVEGTRIERVLVQVEGPLAESD